MDRETLPSMRMERGEGKSPRKDKACTRGAAKVGTQGFNLGRMRVPLKKLRLERQDGGGGSFHPWPPE